MHRSKVLPSLLLVLASLPVSAQFHPVPRPLPRAQVVSQGQPVMILFHTVADTNASRFQGMDAYFSDGSVANDWRIPTGKMLVLKDFSVTQFLLNRVTYDVDGQLMEYFPNGASLAICPYEIKAGRQTVTTVRSLTAGLAFGQPNGPSLGLMSDTPQGLSLQAAELWGFGYITDAN